MIPRPASLAEVSRRALDARAFEYELADFLHEFARAGGEAMLTEPPPLLRERLETGDVFDAYLAAVAVSLAAKIGCRAPLWAKAPERVLREPWFASPGRHMRALLLVESPAAFRERNLFVSANALSVA
jgi:hypothetical protein